MGLCNTLVQDVRYGARSLRRSPFLALAIVLTLGLGIGLDTGVFTIINGLFFLPRVEKDPGSFAQVLPEDSGTTSLEDYRAYQAGARSVGNLAAWHVIQATINKDPRPIAPALVTCNLFSLYGLEHAKLGRLFVPGDCSAPGGAPVVVIGEEIWRTRFGANPHIVGTVINVDKQPLTVVGVTPARSPGKVASGMWIPWTMQPLFEHGDYFRQAGVPWLTVEGRLQPGYSRSAARAELEVIARQQDRLHPGRKTSLIVTNGSLMQRPGTRTIALWVMLVWMGMITLVLLMACSNVTTLLLSRAAARRQEIAIRLSLGAGRTRLLRMLLTESLMLAAAAGAICVYLAYRAPDVFLAIIPNPDMPYYRLQPDLAVFLYLGGITLLGGFMAGLAPAAESLKVDLSAPLKGQEAQFGSGGRKWGLRDLLIVAQVAMSLVLLVCCGLIVRAQHDMRSANLGLETKQILVVPLRAEAPSLYRTLEQRARALPGVQAVCYATSVPFLGVNSMKVRLPGQPESAERRTSVNTVSADFFETLRIPIVRGRAFQSQDVTAEKVAARVVVSETFVRTFWPGENPIGKVIEEGQGERREVIGVAGDIQDLGPGIAPEPALYLLQHPHALGGSLLIRFEGDPQTVERAFGSVSRELGADEFGLPRRLASIVEEQTSDFWRFVQMMLFLGGVALLLAVVGIYGVVAFTVSRRTREMGLRMALGATRVRIVRSVLSSGMKPVLAGGTVGLVLALTLSLAADRVMKNAPVALVTRDPLVYVAVFSLLAACAAVAMLVPAVRAAASDPMRALRHD